MSSPSRLPTDVSNFYIYAKDSSTLGAFRGAQIDNTIWSPLVAADVNGTTVSYTHLDVYKRQVMNCEFVKVFVSSFQIFLRQDYPIFLLMTGAVRARSSFMHLTIYR